MFVDQPPELIVEQLCQLSLVDILSVSHVNKRIYEIYRQNEWYIYNRLMKMHYNVCFENANKNLQELDYIGNTTSTKTPKQVYQLIKYMTHKKKFEVYILDVQVRDLLGETPLFYVIRENNIHGTIQLLEANVPVNVTNHNGLNIFHLMTDILDDISDNMYYAEDDQLLNALLIEEDAWTYIYEMARNLM